MQFLAQPYSHRIYLFPASAGQILFADLSYIPLPRSGRNTAGYNQALLRFLIRQYKDCMISRPDLYDWNTTPKVQALTFQENVVSVGSIVIVWFLSVNIYWALINHYLDRNLFEEVVE